jgi:hypothetical protein
MWGFRDRQGQRKLERRLRSARPVPDEDFVRRVVARTDEAPSPRPWSRLAFAGAVSALIVGTVASFGGVGYATAGADSTYSAVKQIVVKHKVSFRVDKSSASSQYPGTPEPPKSQPAGQAVKGSAVGQVAAAKTLPFTGVSLLITVVIGSALFLLGLMLRRRERSDS